MNANQNRITLTTNRYTFFFVNTLMFKINILVIRNFRISNFRIKNKRLYAQLYDTRKQRRLFYFVVFVSAGLSNFHGICQGKSQIMRKLYRPWTFTWRKIIIISTEETCFHGKQAILNLNDAILIRLAVLDEFVKRLLTFCFAEYVKTSSRST